MNRIAEITARATAAMSNSETRNLAEDNLNLIAALTQAQADLKRAVELANTNAKLFDEAQRARTRKYTMILLRVKHRTRLAGKGKAIKYI